MKLQIVEYKIDNIMSFNPLYTYTLELDGKRIIQSSSTTELTKKRIANLLLDKIPDLIRSFNINDYPYSVDKSFPGLRYKVIFEQEVSNLFLKELYTKHRIEDMEEDFK